MKRVLVGLFAVFVIFEAVVVGSAVNQPHNLGYVALTLSSGTVTQIINSTAPSVGYLKWCYNCVANGAAGTMCISTGTTVFNQFILSTGTVCK